MIKNITKLILGTVQFGLDYGINNKQGKPSENEVKSILDCAHNNGITFLDTAEAYGDSQKRIGEYHKVANYKFNITTKYNSKINLPKSIGKRVEYNLSTLNVDRLYSYMFHSFEEYRLFYPDFKNDLNFLINDELIGKLGVSVYTNEEALKVLEDNSIQLIQLPYNLLDNLNKRKAVLKRAKERGVEIHTRSVFLQGLFFKELCQLPNRLQKLAPYLKLIRQIQENNNIQIQEVALNYALENKMISKILIGVDSLMQLQDNIKSASINIDENILKEVDKIDVKETELLNPVNWK